MSDVRTFGRVFAVASAGVVSLAILTWLAVYAFGGVNLLTAGFRGDVDEKNKTVADGAFRVTSYERFYELCSGVKTKESRIRNYEDQLKDDSLGADEKAEMRKAILANKNQRVELINEYNALTSNKYRTAYKDKGLPYELDETDMHTTCTA